MRFACARTRKVPHCGRAAGSKTSGSWATNHCAGPLPEPLEASGIAVIFGCTDALVCEQCFLRVSELFSCTVVRLERPQDYARDTRKYVQKAKQAVVLRAAASAWAEGVPWAEAFTIAQEALQECDAAVRRGKGGRGKGAGRGRA